ncbi:MAG: haloacid dehalogenase-like hydrolase [Spirochaetales bacterium]|nr:haloacid dehalogenase-like hydrolase [Spirochaetales bacterium]
MNKWNIIWDYDGTILPFMPYDSEQFFLDYLINIEKDSLPFFKRAVSRAAIFADQKQLLGHSFKKYFNWIVKDTEKSVIEKVTTSIASQIPDSHIDVFSDLYNKGFPMSIISCGTWDLCHPPLVKRKADGFFSRIVSNYFTYRGNRISGMDYHVRKGEDKITHADALGYDPVKTIVIGDGYTDLPLLDWCSFPVLIDPDGKMRKRFTGKKYNYIKSVPELPELLSNSRLII